jgi:hypothetical protein
MVTFPRPAKRAPAEAAVAGAVLASVIASPMGNARKRARRNRDFTPCEIAKVGRLSTARRFATRAGHACVLRAGFVRVEQPLLGNPSVRVLRKIVDDCIPGRAVVNKGVELWPNAGVVIECAHSD